MANKSIRLASTLSFDENQEKDILQFIDSFNSSHKMGEFLSALIRIAFETPEVLVVKNGTYTEGSLVEVIKRLGKTPDRTAYLKEISRQTLEMQKKVDEMYDMCLKMYVMLECGKRIGVEEKVKNQALAQIAIEQQLATFKNKFDLDCSTVLFQSNKIMNFETKSKEMMDYIISCYEPIINALKTEIKPIEIDTVTKHKHVEEIEHLKSSNQNNMNNMNMMQMMQFINAMNQMNSMNSMGINHMGMTPMGMNQMNIGQMGMNQMSGMNNMGQMGMTNMGQAGMQGMVGQAGQVGQTSHIGVMQNNQVSQPVQTAIASPVASAVTNNSASTVTTNTSVSQSSTGSRKLDLEPTELVSEESMDFGADGLADLERFFGGN